ncbi:aldehyde dehydrogenase 3b1 [Penicillium sp. IBT 35674x]|nr:aldehyde dehydrogenase 3b1 [Penicillium sp. IBT 35674x]
MNANTKSSADTFRYTYDTLRATFASGKTKDLRWRKWQLKQLYWLLDENEDALLSAMSEDLHRHPFESLSTDIAETKNEVIEMIDNVEKWSKGQAPPHAGFIFGRLGKAWIRKEPFGLALIIGAWNYPVATLLAVAIAAIGAGNSVLLKPSEMAPQTEQLLIKLVARYMDTTAIGIVSAAPEDMELVLQHKFDFIFYTGSSRVGRIIAAAAAKHVTPTALELGGQAPGLVTKNANLDLTAKRLANAKLMNLGQVCVNVNHVFAEPEIYDELVTRLKFWMKKFYDEGHKTLAHMINHRNYDRVHSLLEGTKGTVIYSGEHCRETKALHPTIVGDVKPTDTLLSEELFGPVLPIIKSGLDEAIRTINSMPTPLGLYIFSETSSEIDLILSLTNSGGVTVNDVAVHADVPSAPFGGVGESGYGSYHGKWGFDTFSHNRTVVHMPGSWLEYFTGWRYPPFNIKNRGEVDPPRPKFRKGETMADQGLRKSLISLPFAAFALIAATLTLHLQRLMGKSD